VEWALDVPMFLFKRGGAVIRNTGQTFRSFMTDGFKGFFPLRKDWEMHLNTLFPEVRLKQTIEVRGADSVQRDFVCALPALWTGIFYDETALAEAEELSATWSFAELEELRPSIVREALRAEFRGVRLADLAQRLLAIAAAGLERRGRLNKRGQDERVHLEPIMRLAEHARCPADVLLDGLHGSVSEVRAAVIHRGRLV